jgi:hypothetical protein
MFQLPHDDDVPESVSAFINDQTYTYVEHSNDKVYIIAGPEYGNLEGSLFIIHKALFGLRSSGLHWNEGFSLALRADGFVPCNASPDIWMRENEETYEHIGFYVDGVAANEIHKTVDVISRSRDTT